ncbi:MAG: hypothetical protein ACI83W_002649, partial [Marinoscillum sp.]
MSTWKSLLELSQSIKNEISQIATQNIEELQWKSDPKSWSILEILNHLSLIYELYADNLDRTIQAAPQPLRKDQAIKYSLLGRLSIFSQRPKNDKRRMKMKTFDFFQPDYKYCENHEVVKRYLDNKEFFEKLLKEASTRDLAGLKVPTALGQKVRFYVSECFDFIFAH